MNVIEEIRDGRIGRVPVWAIGVGIAALIILFVVIRSKMQSGDETPGAPGEGELDSIDGIPDGSFSDNISGRFPSYTQPPDPRFTRPVTNAQWLVLAFDYLVGLGKIPSDVQAALQAYLSGKTLTDVQQQLVNLALANNMISLPPEGVALPGGGGNPDPIPGPQYVPAPVNGENLYDWSYQYGGFVKLFGAVKGTGLNPQHRNYMVWEGSGTKIPKFKPGTPAVKVY